VVAASKAEQPVDAILAVAAAAGFQLTAEVMMPLSSLPAST
jgi:hypothetical protein